MHLPVTIREIKAGYLSSPYFKDIYMYLVQNELPSSMAATRRTETLVERYLLLDSLLSRLNTTPDKEATALAIPETCRD